MLKKLCFPKLSTEAEKWLVGQLSYSALEGGGGGGGGRDKLLIITNNTKYYFNKLYFQNKRSFFDNYLFPILNWIL